MENPSSRTRDRSPTAAPRGPRRRFAFPWGRARRDLLIVGTGGFARETAEAVRAPGSPWRLAGFLDDDPLLHGTDVLGTPVLGPAEAVHDRPRAAVVVCTGNPRRYTSRRAIVLRLGLPPERYATVLHPGVHLPASARVGPGTVVLAGCVLTADLAVGAHVAVMPQAVLTHDTRVGDWATLGAGVRLGGGARLAEGAYAGAAGLIRERTTVGAWSLIGMGSVVLHDVPPGEVWAGSPARYLRPAPVPPGLLPPAPVRPSGTHSSGTRAGG